MSLELIVTFSIFRPARQSTTLREKADKIARTENVTTDRPNQTKTRFKFMSLASRLHDSLLYLLNLTLINESSRHSTI